MLSVSSAVDLTQPRKEPMNMKTCIILSIGLFYTTYQTYWFNTVLQYSLTNTFDACMVYIDIFLSNNGYLCFLSFFSQHDRSSC